MICKNCIHCVYFNDEPEGMMRVVENGGAPIPHMTVQHALCKLTGSCMVGVEKCGRYEQKEEAYKMCRPQPVQLDCRLTDCRFHESGACTNNSPAITLNPKGFTCWSETNTNKS